MYLVSFINVVSQWPIPSNTEYLSHSLFIIVIIGELIGDRKLVFVQLTELAGNGMCYDEM